MQGDPAEDDDDFTWDDDDPLDEAASGSDTPSGDQDPAPQPTPDDRETLEQKIRSAEGRYRKSEEKLQQFQDSIQGMQQQLAALNEGKPDPDGDPDSGNSQEVVPDGWSKEEWEEFKDDQPVTAELHEKQIRQVNEIKDSLETTQAEQAAQIHRQQFRQTVTEAHPDYDELIGKEREQIEDFIQKQSNPIVRQAYQQVYEQGTADEVVQLVSDYKAVRQDSGRSRQSAVDNALAVTSRSTSPNVSHKGTIDPEDFDAAWDEFEDDAIDD